MGLDSPGTTVIAAGSTRSARSTSRASVATRQGLARIVTAGMRASPGISALTSASASCSPVRGAEGGEQRREYFQQQVGDRFGTLLGFLAQIGRQRRQLIDEPPGGRAQSGVLRLGGFLRCGSMAFCPGLFARSGQFCRGEGGFDDLRFDFRTLGGRNHRRTGWRETERSWGACSVHQLLVLAFADLDLALGGKFLGKLRRCRPAPRRRRAA